MNKSFFYNPFIVIAGAKSFIIGLFGFLLTIYLTSLTGTHFYGLLNINFAKDSDFWVYGVENLLHWFLLSFTLCIAGIILSKSKIRIIDVFGTILFSRIVLIIAPLFRLIPFFQSFVIFSVNMYLIAGIYIISCIWFITLSFNAYKISCNLKNEKLIISYITCLLVSEVLTKIFIHIII